MVGYPRIITLTSGEGWRFDLTTVVLLLSAFYFIHRWLGFSVRVRVLCARAGAERSQDLTKEPGFLSVLAYLRYDRTSS